LANTHYRTETIDTNSDVKIFSRIESNYYLTMAETVSN